MTKHLESTLGGTRGRTGANAANCAATSHVGTSIKAAVCSDVRGGTKEDCAKKERPLREQRPSASSVGSGPEIG